MNLGRTLVGAIVGAAIAIGIYLGIRVGMESQAIWFPIITGILVGLGVMKTDSAPPKTASYARGAIAGLIAAGAIYGSDVIAQEVMTSKAASAAQPAKAASAPAKNDTEEETTEAAAEEPVEEVVAQKRDSGTAQTGNIGAPKSLNKDSMWPFISMAGGIFLAYELARGTAPKTVVETTETPVPVDNDEEDA
ncbi:hypothetical protein [Adhaeretor mobilis]|uniref:Uncharacterized protein n=1 Tax=Adhaeretor mobilis TaxID=1930276 RepID=A0A517MRL9_9BACT|nr:hypothetical protein [Adhaeretor mobilis]QDS97532.1 hypothetical protein HG15A2_07950 [Adhaeretor mobilis]